MIQRAKTSKKKMIRLASLEVTMTNYQYYPAIRYETEVFCNPKKKTIAARILTVFWTTSKKIYTISSLFCPATHTPLSINKKKKHKKESAQKTKTNEH